jgi:hypothetical protein
VSVLGPGANRANTTGRPISATEERKTVQTLSDGTELLNSDSNLFYRDVLGRTRLEQTVQGKTIVTIRDPVAGFIVRIDPEQKSANKAAMAARGGRSGSPAETSPAALADLQKMEVIQDNRTTSLPATAAASPARLKLPDIAEEDLGIETVNGVPAVHTRNTQTIPAGKIGNNKDIHIVNERWYSDDLEMLVKSVNSDPRFGVTTYQLTNVARSDPDPTLFQIPADYTVTDAPGRGAAMQMVPIKQ